MLKLIFRSFFYALLGVILLAAGLLLWLWVAPPVGWITPFIRQQLSAQGITVEQLEIDSITPTQVTFHTISITQPVQTTLTDMSVRYNMLELLTGDGIDRLVLDEMSLTLPKQGTDGESNPWRQRMPSHLLPLLLVDSLIIEKLHIDLPIGDHYLTIPLTINMITNPEFSIEIKTEEKVVIPTTQPFGLSVTHLALTLTADHTEDRWRGTFEGDMQLQHAGTPLLSGPVTGTLALSAQQAETTLEWQWPPSEQTTEHGIFTASYTKPHDHQHDTSKMTLQKLTVTPTMISALESFMLQNNDLNAISLDQAVLSGNWQGSLATQQGNGSINAHADRAALPQLSMHDIALSAHIDSLPPRNITNGQLQVDRIELQPPVTQIAANWSYALDSSTLTFSNASASWLDGLFSLAEPVSWAIGQPGGASVMVNNMSSTPLLEQLDRSSLLFISSPLSGTVTVHWSADGAISLPKGTLSAVTDGTLRYQGAGLESLSQGAGKDAATALQDFTFNELSLSTRLGVSDENDELLLTVKGKNEQAFGGRPIHLNINVGGDIIDALLASIELYRTPESLLQRTPPPQGMNP